MYVYPITGRFNQGLYNPYVDDLITALSPALTCVNKDYPSRIGIFNMLKFWRKTEVFFLNWIEDLPDKKGGIWQMIFFLLLIPAIKLSGKRLVWTVHNKQSHDGRRQGVKAWFIRRLMNTCDLMPTHSREGSTYVARQAGKDNAQRVFYFPHPIKRRKLPSLKGKPPRYDILIWGTMSPYKGIDRFLSYLYERDLANAFCIRVVGKIPDASYKKMLMSFANERICIEDRFISDEALDQAMADTACVLFTYHPEYILSSGVLADSIGAGKRVLGPAAGAFFDLQELGMLDTYHDFDECVEKLHRYKVEAHDMSHGDVAYFTKAYSWQAYGEHLCRWLGISGQEGKKVKPIKSFEKL